MARKKRKRTYGQGSVYLKKETGKWWIKWREPDRAKPQTDGGFTSHEEAEIQLALVLAKVKAGQPGQHKINNQTLNELGVDWLPGRTGRSNYDDRNRWKNHIAPGLGNCLPHEVTVALLKKHLKAWGEATSKATARLIFSLLSSFFSDLREDDTHVMPQGTGNPCEMLSKSTRRKLMKSDYDWRNTPYLHTEDDVKRVYRQLLAALVKHVNYGRAWSVAVAFAVCALAGLRPAEVVVLEWEQVDLANRLIWVRWQKEKRRGKPRHMWNSMRRQMPKSGKARSIRIQPSLLPILREWQAMSGGVGLVCPPLRNTNSQRRPTDLGSSRRRLLDEHDMANHLETALKELGLADLTWYQATRHTFASQFIKKGGKMGVLADMLGHSSSEVTRRYAHFEPGYVDPADLARLDADFGTFPDVQAQPQVTAPTTTQSVGTSGGAIGYQLATGEASNAPNPKLN